jgi:hypothetical protein
MVVVPKGKAKKQKKAADKGRPKQAPAKKASASARKKPKAPGRKRR